MKWECFHDVSYYDMWAVRPVGTRNFDRTIHLFRREDAEHAVKVLDDLTAKVSQPPSLIGTVTGEDGRITGLTHTPAPQPQASAEDVALVSEAVRACIDECGFSDETMDEIEAAWQRIRASLGVVK